ncbi:MAG TPA: hypothetical protein DEF88_09655 [Porphyromonadaceae bacterium]|nr:hypothetical protein [Porphyromonadaceae bacterium]
MQRYKHNFRDKKIFHFLFLSRGRSCITFRETNPFTGVELFLAIEEKWSRLEEIAPPPSIEKIFCINEENNNKG